MNIVFTLIILFFIVCILSIIYCHFSIKTSNYLIKSSKVKDKVRIVHLSDLHCRKFGKNNQKIISFIYNQKPDIIVMTGDMINGKNEDVKFLEKFILSIKSNVNKDCVIYYVMGNREFRLEKDEYIKFKQMLNNNKVIVLENNSSMLASKNISLYGLNYYNRDSKEYYEKIGTNNKNVCLKFDMPSFISKTENSNFNILLAHDPSDFEKYTEYGYDLVLSGHIHGGVIRIPFINRGLLSPDVKFFPKYDAGVYKKDKSTMYISKGLGYGTIPFRLFNRPEIVNIDISPD